MAPGGPSPLKHAYRFAESEALVATIAAMHQGRFLLQHAYVTVGCRVRSGRRSRGVCSRADGRCRRAADEMVFGDLSMRRRVRLSAEF